MKKGEARIFQEYIDYPVFQAYSFYSIQKVSRTRPIELEVSATMLDLTTGGDDLFWICGGSSEELDIPAKKVLAKSTSLHVRVES